MDSNAKYGYGKLWEAIHILATHPEDVRKRLEVAGVDILVGISQLKTFIEDKPEIKAKANTIKKILTKYPDEHNQGQLVSTCRRIRKRTGQKVAKELLDLAYMLKPDFD